MSQVRASVRIQGKVQGVNYRYNTLQAARRHNVTGWVKNLSDGDVQAVFEGEEDQVRRLIDWCREGSPAAHVENIDVDWQESAGEFSAFDIAH